MTHIAEGTRTGHASWSREYAIGYHNCYACRKQTPDPPQTLLDTLAREGATISTIWPWDQWNPPGWMKIPDLGGICDDCSRAVTALLNNRREIEFESPGTDYEVLRGNLLSALDLAQAGLMANFPPEPTRRPQIGYPSWYLAPGTTSPMWGSYEDYKVGVLRDQIRKIKNALTGTILPEEE